MFRAGSGTERNWAGARKSNKTNFLDQRMQKKRKNLTIIKRSGGRGGVGKRGAGT